MAALPIILVFGECEHAVYMNSDIDETVLEVYSLLVEDTVEWNVAAEQIVQMIAAENS